MMARMTEEEANTLDEKITNAEGYLRVILLLSHSRACHSAPQSFRA